MNGLIQSDAHGVDICYFVASCIELMLYMNRIGCPVSGHKKLVNI